MMIFSSTADMVGPVLPPELDPRAGRARRRRRATKGRDVAAGVRVGVQLLAAMLSLAVVVGSGLAWATYRNFDLRITRVDDAPGEGTTAAKSNIDGRDQNILIAGNDDRTGYTAAQLQELGTTQDGGGLNTDTLMLLHVPADGSKATMVSMPRDSYVAIPGHGMNKINATYVFGLNDHDGDKRYGWALLRQTVENLTGLKIDHFVMVNLLGFYNISKAIGGVQVCLNRAMRPARTTADVGVGWDSGREPDGTFVYSFSGIDLPEGRSTIQGKQALAFVRQRHGLANGDLDRIKRQQYFLSAVFHKISSGGVLANPLKSQKLLKAVSSSLTIDKGLDPLQLAKQMQNLTAGNVRFTTIPIQGFDDNSPVGSVELIDAAAMPGFIDGIIGVKTPLQSAAPAKPATVTVAVVNDTDSNNHVEQANAAALRKLGFTVTIPPATSTVLAHTTIQYPTGAESAAKAVLDVVPGAVLEHTPGISSVALALGNNGVQVKTLSAPEPATGTPGQPAPSVSTSAPVLSTADQAVGCIN
jgi:LCP family protein required for cell wall assembly